MPLQKFSARDISRNPSVKYISAMSALAVGVYWNDLSIAVRVKPARLLKRVVRGGDVRVVFV